MERLERHIERLLELKSDRDRKRHLEQHAELSGEEGARVLCRSAVASINSDFDRANRACRVLAILARKRRDELSAGYRDHAWAALYFSRGLDYEKAFLRWEQAVAHFEAAGRDDEAAISRSSGLQTLVAVERLDLFWEWERKARLVFERRGDRLRLARLRSNVASLHCARDEWRLAAQAYESAYEDAIVAGLKSSDIWAILANLSDCYIHLGDLPRAAQLLEKSRAACEDAGLHTSMARLDAGLAYIKYLQGDFASALTIAQRAREYGTQHRLQHYCSVTTLTEAEILHSLSQSHEAERRAIEAFEGLKPLGLTKEQGQALMILGLCARTRGRHPKGTGALCAS